jgi:hypothetical protein
MSIVKLNNNSIKNVTTLGSVSLGSMVLIKKLTASSSATLSFVDGSSSVVLDNTYKEYLFTFNNMHASSDNSTAQEFEFNMSIDSGSNYNVTKTTTTFRSGHDESDSTTQLGYVADYDLAQGTGFQGLTEGDGIDNDQCCSGYMHLFNPSSTTFVKHYISCFNVARHNDFTANWFTAGYANTTSAVDAIQFKFLGGNIDAGTIQLFGVS